MSSERWVLSKWKPVSDAATLPPELDRHAITFGDDTVVLAPESGPPGAAALQPLADDLSLPSIHLVAQVGNRFEAEHPEVPILYAKGRYLLVTMDPQLAREQAQRGCYAIVPISIPDVVFAVRRRETAAAAPEDATSDLLATLSRQRIEQSLEHLISFGTRHSTSAKYQEAAQWAADSMAADGYQVRLEPVAVGSGGGRSFNVVAERPGTGSGPREAVLVTAHLDSVNHEVLQGPAPGADDNGTGAAGVVELAHCLAAHSCSRDLRFILFGGEEQGLFGSIAYVNALPSPPGIHAIINMDMIGTLNGTAAPTVMIEGGQVSVPLMDRLSTAASTYTDLTIQTSLHYFNSDHVPFIDAGIPGVLLIEGNDSANKRVHTARDTIAHVDFDLMTDILRMHLAVLADSCQA
jgi:Peptidase family M28